jgi:hypothetical protein
VDRSTGGKQPWQEKISQLIQIAQIHSKENLDAPVKTVHFSCLFTDERWQTVISAVAEKFC